MSIPPLGFEPCSPCDNVRLSKYGAPPPYWRVIIIEEDGVETLGKTCKDGWGFLSCPNSPRNAEVKAMSKKERDDWRKPLFPIMDVAEYFEMIFSE